MMIEYRIALLSTTRDSKLYAVVFCRVVVFYFRVKIPSNLLSRQKIHSLLSV